MRSAFLSPRQPQPSKPLSKAWFVLLFALRRSSSKHSTWTAERRVRSQHSTQHLMTPADAYRFDERVVVARCCPSSIFFPRHFPTAQGINGSTAEPPRGRCTLTHAPRQSARLTSAQGRGERFNLRSHGAWLTFMTHRRLIRRRTQRLPLSRRGGTTHDHHSSAQPVVDLMPLSQPVQLFASGKTPPDLRISSRVLRGALFCWFPGG